MSFIQAAPELGNQYSDDRVLQSYLHRHLPPDLLQLCLAELEAMGLTAAELFQQQLTEHRLEPTLTQWDGWGNRIDSISLTPLWQRARETAAKSGLVATAYEGNYQPHGRLVQFALVYLFHPSTDMYCCPLAMTDGAARTLLESGNSDLIHRAVGRLTSRDPNQFWISGQWMTETSGGSDLGDSQTCAWQDQGQWLLRGKKWFTSAATSEMALTLARPSKRLGKAESAPTKNRDLALFYVEPRDDQGRLKNIEILRLKDKLGTRKLPTAELLLNDTPATLVATTSGGIKTIAPMLNVTRSWNAVCAVSFMRRAIALARDYAHRREVAGRLLADLPLHQHTLATLQAEYEACFHLTFYVVRQLGLAEHGQLDQEGQRRLGLLIPIAKLLTGKKVVEICSEAIECFGGAGYVEDTGLPQLLRDAQVLPIWEGTTNVLALDVLRVLRDEQVLKSWFSLLRRLRNQCRAAELAPVVEAITASTKQLKRWLRRADELSDDCWQLVARKLALSLGRTTAAALLAEHAQHQLETSRDLRPALAAQLFASHGLEQLEQIDPLNDLSKHRALARALALDQAELAAAISTPADASTTNTATNTNKPAQGVFTES